MENCIQIGSGNLKAWIGEPGKYHTGTRFDWTGFIPQITLYGHTFCTPEGAPWHPNGSGGEGLCNEFRIDEASMGFDDTDRLFLKPGVGLLERPENDGQYHFGVDYCLVKPFDCTMKAGSDYADFHLDPIPLKGLSYTLDKHVGIIDNMLIITTTVTNVGEKPLYFREYNHNFLSMDGLGAHPGVTLTLQKNYKNNVDTPGLTMNEDSISFTDEIKSGFMIICEDYEPHSPMRWELRDEKAQMSVQEWGDFDMTRFLAWGGPHVIAPEVYGDFPVSPGQVRTWMRLWKFYTNCK